MDLNNSIPCIHLISRVVAGLSSPIFGYFSDSRKSLFKGYTRRKSWHLLLTVLYIICQIFFFSQNLILGQIGERTSEAGFFVYNAILLTLAIISKTAINNQLNAIPSEIVDDKSKISGLVRGIFRNLLIELNRGHFFG